MSPLLIVGHRLTPHGLHRRPLAARLPVIVICLPHIRVSERSESTILTLSFGGCAAGTYQHQAAQRGPSVGFPNLGLGLVGVEMASAHADEPVVEVDAVLVTPQLVQSLAWGGEFLGVGGAVGNRSRCRT
jgi:hypothetical protein